jgi:zinc transporter ZupT
MLVATVLARAEFKPDRPLTWPMVVGFVGVLVASVWWYAVELRKERHPRQL